MSILALSGAASAPELLDFDDYNETEMRIYRWLESVDN